MSMHEIEDLVSETIIFLDEVPNSLDLRSIFWNLYRYQKKTDTGITYFRVINILLKRNYIYVIPIVSHPDYKKYKSYFDSLHEFDELVRNPTEKYNKLLNPTIGGYYQPFEKLSKELVSTVAESGKCVFV